MICPKCSKDNPADALFCAQCGERLQRAQPRVCPRCATANDPIFQFCRACKTDLDDPPERYILDESGPDEEGSDYKPQTTPYQPHSTLYAVQSTPFVPDPKPNISPPGMFDMPPGPAFDPQLEPVYDPASDIPPVIAPAAHEFVQDALHQPFGYGPDGDPFAPGGMLTPEGGDLGMETAKRTPRKLKWLLVCTLALCALAFAGAGIFSYMDRVEQSKKPANRWELEARNE